MAGAERNVGSGNWAIVIHHSNHVEKKWYSSKADRDKLFRDMYSAGRRDISKDKR